MFCLPESAGCHLIAGTSSGIKRNISILLEELKNGSDPRPRRPLRARQCDATRPRAAPRRDRPGGARGKRHRRPPRAFGLAPVVPPRGTRTGWARDVAARLAQHLLRRRYARSRRGDRLPPPRLLRPPPRRLPPLRVRGAAHSCAGTVKIWPG